MTSGRQLSTFQDINWDVSDYNMWILVITIFDAVLIVLLMLFCLRLCHQYMKWREEEDQLEFDYIDHEERKRTLRAANLVMQHEVLSARSPSVEVSSNWDPAALTDRPLIRDQPPDHHSFNNFAPKARINNFAKSRGQ